MNTLGIAKNLTAGQRFILNESGTVYVATLVRSDASRTLIQYVPEAADFPSQVVVANLTSVELV